MKNFREEARLLIPLNYSGSQYLFIFTLILSFLIIGSLVLVSSFSWLFFIIGLVSANLIEYCIHRWPLHQKPKWIPKGYKIHSGSHHRFYTHDKMEYELPEDFYEILTPKKITILYILLGGLVSLLIGVVFGASIGLTFFVSMMTYFLGYEWAHFITHIPKTHWIHKFKVIKNLYEHHRHHHNTRVMHKTNFNVFFPLFDFIFRTKAKTHQSPKIPQS